MRTHPYRPIRFQEGMTSAKHAWGYGVRLDDVLVIYRDRASSVCRVAHRRNDIWATSKIRQRRVKTADSSPLVRFMAFPHMSRISVIVSTPSYPPLIMTVGSSDVSSPAASCTGARTHAMLRIADW